jgi:hypothetical protein
MAASLHSKDVAGAFRCARLLLESAQRVTRSHGKEDDRGALRCARWLMESAQRVTRSQRERR